MYSPRIRNATGEMLLHYLLKGRGVENPKKDEDLSIFWEALKNIALNVIQFQHRFCHGCPLLRTERPMTMSNGGPELRRPARERQVNYPPFEPS
jgi:hypothetical protein